MITACEDDCKRKSTKHASDLDELKQRVDQSGPIKPKDGL